MTAGPARSHQCFEYQRSECAALQEPHRQAIDDADDAAEALEPAAHVYGFATLAAELLEPAIEMGQQRVPLAALARLDHVPDHQLEVGHRLKQLTPHPGRTFYGDDAPIHELGAGHAHRAAAHRKAVSDL